MEYLTPERLRNAAIVAGAGVVSYTIYRYAFPPDNPRSSFFASFLGDDHPKSFCCPITYELMEDPVFTADGHTFDREAILHWLREHNTSPVTGLPLPDLTIRPNHALRGEIADYRQARNLPEMVPLTSMQPQHAQEPTRATTTVVHNGRVLHLGRLTPQPAAPGQQHLRVRQRQYVIERLQRLQRQQRQQRQQGQQHQHQQRQQRQQGQRGDQSPQQAQPAHPSQQEQDQAQDSALSLPVPDLDPISEQSVSAAIEIAAQSGVNLSGMRPRILLEFVTQVLTQPPFPTVSFRDHLRTRVGLDPPSENFPRWALETVAVLLMLFGRAFGAGSLTVFRAYLAQIQSLVPDDMAEIGIPLELSTAIANDDLEAVRSAMSSDYGLHRHLSLFSAFACQHGASQTLDLLMQIANSSRITTADGPLHRCADMVTALGHAVVGNQVDFVKQLIESGADVNLAPASSSIGPLQLAAALGHTEILSMLLEAGATPTAYMGRVRGSSPLPLAAAAGHVACCRALIEFERPLLTLMDAMCMARPIVFACEHGQLAVVKLFVSMGVNIEEQGPLIPATLSFEKLTEYLLQAGSDPNVQLPNQNTMLQIAMMNDCRETFELLLEYGADPNRRGSNEHSTLHVACSAGKVEYVGLLLQHDGVELECKTVNNSTPLILACWGGHVEIVRMLLYVGADLFAQTSDGDTCLHQAAYHGYYEVLLTLLHHQDAQRPVPDGLILSWWRGLEGTREGRLKLVDMRKHDGSTALHIAAARNAVSAVQVLIDHGANKESVTRAGQTAFALVNDNPSFNPRIVDLLRV
eukprot:m.245968 g.245968  ORF g.245968 m.245968 type:complete len:805 (+) comp17470_c0_seq10:65-2479(+)